MEKYKALLKHFLFYHQKHILIGLAALSCLLWLIVRKAETVEPDYHIAVVNAVRLHPDTLQRIEAAMTEAGEDRNGDGRVVVRLNTYWLRLGEEAPGSGEEYFQTVQALDADLVGRVSGIFLLEDTAAFADATGGLQILTGGTLEGLTLCLRGDADDGYSALFSKLGE